MKNETPATEERVAHTPQPWVPTFFSTPNGSPIETVNDVAETIAYSARRGDLAELHGVTVTDLDADGRSIIICYTGNGPKSEQNAQAICRAVNAHEALVSALQSLVDETQAILEYVNKHGGCSEAIKAVARARAALSLATEGK